MIMIKNFKKLGIAFVSFIVGLGFSFPTIVAGAEELPSTSAEEVIDSTIAPEQEEKPETTFDDFLAWAQQEANRYGYGEDFAGAIEAIKAAATQKQVTISTIASVALALGILAYIIVKHIREKGFKTSLVKLVKTFDEKMDNSIKGTNALIDGENTLIEDETANGKTAKETKEDVAALKRCMGLFISAFLRFTDGVKLGDNKKTEVQSNLLNALKEINTLTSEEGASNENNEI